MAKYMPMGQRAALRIKAIAHEIGAETSHNRGWIAQAGRELGLPYSTIYGIASGNTTAVGIRTIETICKHVGVSTSDLMEDKGRHNGKRKH